MKGSNSNDKFAITTRDRFVADSLNLEIAGGPLNDPGIAVNGSHTVIDAITVTSKTPDQPGLYALYVGDESAQKSNIRINGIALTGFRAPMRVINVTESRFSNATIRNFQTGVYVQDTTDTTFDKFKVTGTSPDAEGVPGQNGLLLEAKYVDYGCRNLRFRDWIVDGSPEHNYRIGGACTVGDITFEDCISRNPGNATKKLATGGAAFKVLGNAGHRHKNIRLVNCSAEDGSTTGNGVNNFSQYSFGHIDGLTVINPTLRAWNKTYSGQHGLIVFACTNVDIVEPNIRDVLRNAIMIFKDATEITPPFGVSNLRINGGFLDGGSTNNVILLDDKSAVMKDIFIDDVVVSRGGAALRSEAPPEGTVGAYENVHVRLKYINAPTASTNPPVTGTNLVTVDYTGPIYGTYSIPSKDGGKYLNTGNGSRYIRKASAWVQE
ncbi:hypothetical protein SAMN04487912_102333 [Arthrobacter sp. cf158]|uniref:hypothetical protein n=1 Tax=Arthrobacter sp. cf158 TaxID=1761744 RepID=UPI000898CF60|nr:hypothetical protein [Arthrobacter sp. cf158]SDW32586.1 hypothetical protein SAMN04487912_102333 [Arthrobacter sp. cf158]